jgi:hypothetical protein
LSNQNGTGSTTNITLRCDPEHIASPVISANLFYRHIRAPPIMDLGFLPAFSEDFAVGWLHHSGKATSRSYEFRTPGSQTVYILGLPVLC